MVIDHKNRITVDNKWENLRLATYKENNNNRRRKTDKPSFDPNGLTKGAIIDIKKVEEVAAGVKIIKDLYHESAYVGSIFLGRYKPDTDIYMSWEFNIAQFLLFEELPRTEIHKRLNLFPMTEQQVKGSGQNIMTTNEMQVLIDKHIASVLNKLGWEPLFLD